MTWRGAPARNSILEMQNVVPVTEHVASRALAPRQEAYTDEVRRLVDAGYAVLRRTGGLDPRVADVVREAGLSNQAFYRHFRGKDELLLAIVDDGQRQLVEYLEHRLAGVEPGAAQVRAWIEGVLEQARNPDAADNTRPFAIGSARMADQFPEEMGQSRESVVAPLRAAVAATGGDPELDADAVYQLTMGTMNDALVRRVTPSKTAVAHVVEFALAGVG